MPWLACENSSVTLTTQLTSSTPVAAARSKPRVLSTSPIHDAGPSTAERTPATTASPSAICGTSFGLTNEAISARRRPADAQREMSSTFCSVLNRAESFCSPSRALTSTIWIAFTAQASAYPASSTAAAICSRVGSVTAATVTAPVSRSTATDSTPSMAETSSVTALTQCPHVIPVTVQMLVDMAQGYSFNGGA